MGFIVITPESLSQFEQVHTPTEIRDPLGRVLGFFHPVDLATIRSPMSREELEERRKDRSGKTLDEFFPPRMRK